MRIFAVVATILSIFGLGISIEYDKNQPLWGNCTDSSWGRYCHWDENQHVWIDKSVEADNWFAFSHFSPAQLEKIREGEKRPVKKRYIFTFTAINWLRKPDGHEIMAGVLALQRHRRFVGINVEGGEWPEESRIWPHLGILYVGTIAKQENYEVVLWDELIQGKAPLESLIQPGDTVGLSLVTTGINRGVEVARQAKELGARQVIAGNDSAMFRATQLLRIADKPIDAVFTSNSLHSIRTYFRNDGAENIPHVTRDANVVPYVSNDAQGVALEKTGFTAADFFTLPDLGLFKPEYWNMVWSAYRSQFGHKHSDQDQVRNALVHLAQGCGRASTGDVCDYCTIRHVANVFIPEERYLVETLETYTAFGINTFFNVTDSSFEMSRLADQLSRIGTVDSLVIYGRAQAIAHNPELLEKWLGVVNERLLINCGIDSADERILQLGINKSGRSGSRLEENKRAIRTIKAAGTRAHLHYSLIFGSPGETEDSCKRNLEFLQWTIDMLGQQLDVVEGDIFWVNFGAPCSAIFTNYHEAVKRATLAGKSISRDEWYQNFARYADELSVPHSCERAWYQFFTNISFETALEYNAQVKKMMSVVPNHVTGREFAFKPPTI